MWLSAAAGDGNASLKIALEAALDVVRTRGTSRLSVGTAAEILQASVRAVALRAEFLDRMPAGVAAAGKPVLAAALDATLATIFDQPGAKAAWRLTRADAVVGVVRTGLGELARFGPTPDRVGKLDGFLRDQAKAIEAARPWDLETFGAGLRTALEG